MSLAPGVVLDGDAPCLLDEWQLASEVWNQVRHACDEGRRNDQFIPTGSDVPADDITRHSGAGQLARVRRRPMSLLETGESTGGVAWGIGAGQQNLVEAGQIAAAKASGRAAGGACASDGFYPFLDGIHAAAAAVVQPGCSINDAKVIAAANDRNLAMLLTGERQFRH